MNLTSALGLSGGACAAIVFAAAPALAQSAEPAPAPSTPDEVAVVETVAVVEQDAPQRPATSVEITPYMWGSAFGGTMQAGVGSPRVKVDLGLGDLMKELRAAFFVSGLVEHDRLVFAADLTHAYLRQHVDFPTGNPALPVVDARAKMSQTSMTGLVGYRAMKSEKMNLDLMAGVRA